MAAAAASSLMSKKKKTWWARWAEWTSGCWGGVVQAGPKTIGLGYGINGGDRKRDWAAKGEPKWD
jgi:hypothetical protein